jgi:predicted HTH domain antitoxin
MNDRISIILPPELKKELEQLLAERHVDQSTLIRQLLYTSVRLEKIKHALDDYRTGKKSFGKAAEFAGLTIWEFIEQARKINLRLNFSLAEAREEIQKIEEGFYDQYIPQP